MLVVYLCLFGVQASVIGKPLAAPVTLFSVSCGYWYLSRRFGKVNADRSSGCSSPKQPSASISLCSSVPCSSEWTGEAQLKEAALKLPNGGRTITP